MYHLNPLQVISLPSGKAFRCEQAVDEKGMLVPDSGKDMTVGYSVVSALMFTPQGGKEASMDEKIKRMKLAMRIEGAMFPVELSEEETTKIKELVNKQWDQPAIIYHVCEAISKKEIKLKTVKND